MAKLRVLVVDDMPVRQEFYAKEYAGHDVVRATTFAQAIDAFNNGPYDVLQLDHDLGETPGKYVWEEGDAHERDGSALIKYLVSHVPPEKWPDQVIVHTMNSVVWRHMVADLRSAGIHAYYARATVCQ